MKDRSTSRLLLGGLLFGGCIGWFAWHGAWLGAVSLAAWFAILVSAARSRPRPGARRYRVSRVDGAGEPGGAGQVCGAVQEASALEAAWIAAGLVVVRKRRRIRVGLPGGEPAIVRVPRSGRFGEGFEIWSSDRGTVVRMLDVAARLLGDLRCRGEGEPGELRFYYVVARPRAAA
jgi:hypothetical protein